MSERIRAMALGQQGWGQYGNANEHWRYMVSAPSRRLCRCGCRTRISHTGMANGLALIDGCVLSVARWVGHNQQHQEAP